MKNKNNALSSPECLELGKDVLSSWGTIAKGAAMPLFKRVKEATKAGSKAVRTSWKETGI